MRPPVAWMRPMMARPVVVLPQPDSPTRLRVSPGWSDEADAVDRPHVPGRAAQEPGLDGKVDLQVLDHEQRRPPRPARPAPARHRVQACRCAAAARPPRRSGRPPAGAVRPGAAAGPRRRRSRRSRPIGQRGWKGQPGGRSVGVGGWPGIGSSRASVGVDPRHALEQRRPCRDGAGCRRSRRPGRSRRCGRHT